MSAQEGLHSLRGGFGRRLEHGGTLLGQLDEPRPCRQVARLCRVGPNLIAQAQYEKRH